MIVFIDGQAVEWSGSVAELLELHRPYSQATPVALDTETSGLFVDGNREQGVPARVSVVSLAYRDQFNEIISIAIPFDQGWRQSKPGPWDDRNHRWVSLFEMGSDIDWAAEGRQWLHDNAGQGSWLGLLSWLQGRRLVMHHAKYDCHIMDAGLDGAGTVDLHSQVIWDTMLFQMVTEPLHPSGLKPTAARIWGEHETDEQAALKPHFDALPKWIANGDARSRKRYDLIPWSVLGPYAGKDAELTLRLYEHQCALVEDGVVVSELYGVVKRELALSHLLLKMENRGVEFDAAGMRAEAPKLRSAIAAAERELPFTPATDSQAKRWFFGEQLMCEACCVDMSHRGKEATEVEIKSGKNKGQLRRRWVPCSVCEGTGDSARSGLALMPVKVSEKTREPSLDDEVMQRLVSDGAQGAAAWSQLAGARSALSKWYTRWPDLVGPDGRVRTSFRQGRMESDRPGQSAGGAISGRLSVERWQAQAIPHDYRIIEGVKPVRRFIRARRNSELWEIDLGQAEVRIAAFVTRCEKLRLVCASNVSVHDANTKMVFGLTPEAPDWDQMRSVAKRVTFGVLYGAGVRTLRGTIAKETGFDFGEQRTREFIAAFRAAYPEVPRVFRKAQMKADRNQGGCGFVRLAGGRIRWFGWAEHTSKALNQVIQGGQAEIIKVAALRIEQELPGIIVSMVHDSLWLEVKPGLRMSEAPPAQVQRAQTILCRTFEEYYSTPDFVVPFISDAKRLDK